MYALWNKKTGRFLVIDAEKEEKCYSYEQPYMVAVQVIRESRFQTTLFLTKDKHVAYALKKTGKWDEIKMDFGCGESKFELKDLEVVRLDKKKKRRKQMGV